MTTLAPSPMSRVEAERITERILSLRAHLVNRIATDPESFLPGHRRRRAKSGWIYFIQAQETYAIKIGWAVDVNRRMKELQTGNSAHLALVGAMSGTVRDEKRLHRHFQDCHLRGEWFAATPDLIQYIEENAR